MSLVEINFDGIVGPSHNYAGLSLGNIASASHKGDPSFPRAAALQGIAGCMQGTGTFARVVSHLRQVALITMGSEKETDPARIPVRGRFSHGAILVSVLASVNSPRAASGRGRRPARSVCMVRAQRGLHD